MRQFSLLHVSRILNLKPHVVRYWEQEIGLLSPKKDLNGRKYYRMRDLHLLFRIKFLIYERLFTVKGAQQKILRESQGRPADLKAEIHLLRDSVLASLYSFHRLCDLNSEIADPSALSPTEEDGADRHKDGETAAAAEDVLDLRRTAAQRLRNGTAAAKRMRLPVFIPRRGPYSKAVKEGERILYGGRAAVLTPVPAGDFAYRPLPLPKAASPLEVTAAKVRAALYAYGRQPKWFLFTTPDNTERLKTFLRVNGNFGLRSGDLSIVTGEKLYLYRKDGTVSEDGSGRPLTVDAGLFGMLHGLSRFFRDSDTEQIACGRSKRRFVQDLAYFALIPLYNLITEYPDPLHIGLHMLYRADFSLKTVPAGSAEEGLYRLNGTALFSLSLLKTLMRELPASAITVNTAALDFQGKDDEIQKSETFAVRTLLSDCITYSERSFALGEESWREAMLPRHKRLDPQEQAHALLEKRGRLSAS